jgi:protein-arginine kinase
MSRQQLEEEFYEKLNSMVLAARLLDEPLTNKDAKVLTKIMVKHMDIPQDLKKELRIDVYNTVIRVYNIRTKQRQLTETEALDIFSRMACSEVLDFGDSNWLQYVK